jgi:aryl-alcohol dehydrogenase-like predicted oxidoreductase/enamine deaminase RidA (YjgF/YER057c/UK114 family)
LKAPVVSSVCKSPDGVVPLTKWVPKPGPEHATQEAVDAAVKLALSRLQCERLRLLQFHTWDYLDGPGRWLQQLKLLGVHEGVGHLGVTNVDTEHLRLALAEGLPIVSNQVCFSLLDRRALGGMCDLADEKGVKLLAFGVLAGGLLTDRWLGKSPPTPTELSGNWSLAKYSRFVPLFGGWALLQELLRALQSVALRHSTTIAAVATQWVLAQKAVGGVIIGARLGRSSRLEEHQKAFGVDLSAADLREINCVLERSQPIPGDCGDEYRRPPFLTASGDLSHHLSSVPAAFVATPMAGHTEREPRLAVDSGSVWERIANFSRATRIGRTIRVSGTTATSPLDGTCVGGQDAGAQTSFALDIIEAALKALGGGLEHVVRTRLLVRDVDADWEAVARAHGRRFARAGVRPSNTLVGAALVGAEYLVEIECDAELPPPPGGGSRGGARLP